MKKLIGIVIAALMLTAGTAMADVVTLDYRDVTPGTAITVSYAGSNHTWLTGYYNFDITTAGAYYGYHQGFCVDPASNTSSAVLYDVRPLLGFGDDYKRAAWLLSQSTAANALITQLAVWELMFDTNNVITTGTFHFSGYSDAQTLVNAAMGLDLNKFDTTGFYVAVSPVTGSSYYGAQYQDYIFKTPEPGTLLLMGLGLVGLAGMRRKK